MYCIMGPKSNQCSGALFNQCLLGLKILGTALTMMLKNSWRQSSKTERMWLEQCTKYLVYAKKHAVKDLLNTRNGTNQISCTIKEERA